MSNSRGQSSKFETAEEYFRNMSPTTSISGNSSSSTSSTIPYEKDDKHIDPRIVRTGHTTVMASTSGTITTRNSSTSSTIQSLSSADEQEIVGKVAGIILDYALLPESSEKDAQSAVSFAKFLPDSNVYFTQTIYNGVQLHYLHSAILSGDLDTLMKRMEQHPELLLETLDEKECMTIQGPSGHKASLTPYRTALATEDTEMAEKIRDKLIKMGRKDIADAEYNAQFPAGWEKAEETKWAPIFTQLNKLAEVISKNPGDIKSSGDPLYNLSITKDSEVAKELTQFRSLLQATMNEVTTTGRHFNPYLLLAAFQIYDNHFHDYFGNDWEDPRALLFWQQGIGSIQRYMPVNYMQAFSDGLNNTIEKLEKGRPQGRSLKIEGVWDSARGWVPAYIYPISSSLLGFDFAIYAVGAGRSGGNGWRCGGAPCTDWFRSLCQSKTAGLQNLCTHAKSLVVLPHGVR